METMRLKMIYLKKENAAKRIIIYRRNHRVRQDPWSVRNVSGFIWNFEETGVWSLYMFTKISKVKHNIYDSQ